MIQKQEKILSSEPLEPVLTSREAYIILNLLSGVGPVRVKHLLANFSSPEHLLSETSSSLAKIKGIGLKTASIIGDWKRTTDIDTELNQTVKAGVNIVTLADSSYPDILKEIYDPPLCLYARGDITCLAKTQNIAVVGSRRNSNYGISTTEKLVHSLVSSGWCIISGLARGIDTAAHTAVLKSNGHTVAVLGGGLGSIYPPENVSLAGKICENGLLLSEQPLMFRPDRRSFPMRNRIISGLSQGTLVVEAGAKSGALITAQVALDQGRQVFAVPGRIDTPLSKGCHDLIKQGAKLVDSITDINEEFEFFRDIMDSSRSQNSESDQLVLSNLKLTEIETQLFQLIKRGECSVDELNIDLAIPMHLLLSSLMKLEMKHIIKQLPGKRFTLNTI